MIQKVDHVAIMVTDMERSIDFYTTMFGFAVQRRGANATREMCFLAHPDQPDFAIELIRDIVPQDSYAKSGIVNHLAFTVEKIEEAVAYYRERGITFLSEHPTPGLNGSKIIYFYGPSGEYLQLIERASS